MRTLIVIIIIIVIAGVAFKLDSKSTSFTVSVLHDITDTNYVQPKSSYMLNLFDLTDDPYMAVSFRFANVSDLSVNQISEFELKPTQKWLTNEFEREKEIQEFKFGIDSILNNEMQIGKTHSSIYIPLVRELNYLAHDKSTKRTLIVLSDLMENENGLTFYDAETFKKLQNHPEEIQEYLSRIEKLDRLDGITVLLVYQPQTIEKDNAFRIVSIFYKKLLERQGAIVTITPNL